MGETDWEPQCLSRLVARGEAWVAAGGVENHPGLGKVVYARKFGKSSGHSVPLLLAECRPLSKDLASELGIDTGSVDAWGAPCRAS